MLGVKNKERGWVCPSSRCEVGACKERGIGVCECQAGGGLA